MIEKRESRELDLIEQVRVLSGSVSAAHLAPESNVKGKKERTAQIEQDRCIWRGTRRAQGKQKRNNEEERDSVSSLDGSFLFCFLCFSPLSFRSLSLFY